MSSQEPHLQLVQPYTTSSEVEKDHDGIVEVADCVEIEGSERLGKEMIQDTSQECATEGSLILKEIGSGEEAALEDTLNCFVCNSEEYLENSQIWVKLQDSFNCQIYRDRCETIGNNEIKVIDALESIFKFDTSCKHVFNSLKDRGDVFICSKCFTLLSKLYELYHSFIASLRASPFLAKVFATAPTLAENQDDKRLAVNQGTSDKALSSNPSLNHLTVEKSLTTSSTGVDIIRNANCLNENSIVAVKPIRKRRLKQNLTNLSPKKPRATKKHSTHLSHEENLSQIDTTRNEIKIDKYSIESQSQGSSVAGEEIDKLEQTSCDRCGKTFKSSSGLKVHYASHDRQKIPCQVCGKYFGNEKSLQLHNDVDHKGVKPYKCPNCDKSFRLKDKRRLHILHVHEKKKLFPCHKCDRSFRSKFHLNNHYVAEHGPEHEHDSIGCKKCKRKFSSKEALDKHMKSHLADADPKEKLYQCLHPNCNKGFPTLTRLKSHRMIHKVQRACICSTCGATYKDMRNLRIHEAKHDESGKWSANRFKCGDCSKGFPRIDSLRNHKKKENHFSPDVIGPTICKATGSPMQDRRKTKDKRIYDDDDDEEGAFDMDVDFPKVETTTTTTGLPKKLKCNNPSKNKAIPTTKIPNIQSSASMSSLCPTMMEFNLDNGRDESSSILDDMDLSSSQRAIQDISGPTLTANSIDRMVALQQPHASSSLPNLFQNSPLLFSSGNTLYPLRDSSDKSISPFCITASAEQVGRDLISEFIMNDTNN